MPRTCTREGCCRKVVARGLCHNHYQNWLNSLPGPLGTENSNEAILAALPATAQQVAEECGLSYEGARKAINKLRDAGRAHIKEFLPPGVESKGRWVSLFAAGPGVDAKLSKQRRRANILRNRRAREARKSPPKPDELLSTMFRKSPQNRPTA